LWLSNPVKFYDALRVKQDVVCWLSTFPVFSLCICPALLCVLSFFFLCVSFVFPLCICLVFGKCWCHFVWLVHLSSWTLTETRCLALLLNHTRWWNSVSCLGSLWASFIMDGKMPCALQPFKLSNTTYKKLWMLLGTWLPWRRWILGKKGFIMMNEKFSESIICFVIFSPKGILHHHTGDGT
jgi:hypothetical protein